MKNKVYAESGQCFQTILPLGCWTPVYKRKQKMWQRALKQCQKAIDNALAVAAIALMLLAGIWVFMVQLAEYAG